MTNTSDDLVVRDNPAEHQFEIDLGGGERAIAAYRIKGDTIAFTHTVVPPAFEGQGIASKLAHFALETAREKGLSVEPACRFFADYMRRHHEVQDLLTSESRQQLGLGSSN